MAQLPTTVARTVSGKRNMTKAAKTKCILFIVPFLSMDI
jgi:hypothetical protein